VTRVFVVASPPAAAAALAARCRSAGLEVLGTGGSLEAQTSTATVIVALEDDSVVSDFRDHHLFVRALVLMSDDPSAVRRVAASGAEGWAVIKRSAPPEDIAAAVNAAARGFGLAPAAQLAAGPPRPAPDWDDEMPEERLTPREREVLELVAQGRSNRRVAAALGISEHTVKFHLAGLYGKLGVSTRTAAVRRGLRQGIIAI
jgi:DNA-binding NarL/FixJ family response regulator